MSLLLAEDNQWLPWASFGVSILALVASWLRPRKAIKISAEALALSKAKELVNLEWTGSFVGHQVRAPSGALLVPAGFATALLVNKGREVFVREAYVEAEDGSKRWALTPAKLNGHPVNTADECVARGVAWRFSSKTIGPVVAGFDEFQRSRRLVLVTQCNETRVFDCPTTLGEIIAKAASVQAPPATSAGDTSAS